MHVLAYTSFLYNFEHLLFCLILTYDLRVREQKVFISFWSIHIRPWSTWSSHTRSAPTRFSDKIEKSWVNLTKFFILYHINCFKDQTHSFLYNSFYVLSFEMIQFLKKKIKWYQSSTWKCMRIGKNLVFPRNSEISELSKKP